LKPKTESKQAEDLSSVIETQKTKTTKEPPSTTPYTKDQIKKMRLKKVGEILTAEKITNKDGKQLLFNGGRIFPEGTLKDEVELPEVKKRILLHYGIADS